LWLLRLWAIWALIVVITLVGDMGTYCGYYACRRYGQLIPLVSFNKLIVVITLVGNIWLIWQTGSLHVSALFDIFHFTCLAYYSYWTYHTCLAYYTIIGLIALGWLITVIGLITLDWVITQLLG
jgi:hypothetical protein